MVEPEQVEKLRTLLRALTPKANDPEGIAQLEQLRAEWKDMIGDQARLLNDQGYSWEAIGRPLGINRSAAWQRYGPSPRRWPEQIIDGEADSCGNPYASVSPGA